MTGLPDTSQSRAVLAGAGRYRVLSELSSVRNNLSALSGALRDERVWGLPAGNCVVVEDPAQPPDVLAPIAKAARETTDTLLFYYAGHGLIDPKRGELHLALTGSDPEQMWTAVLYSQIRDLLLDSRARRTIVILDCCYSARAFGRMGSAGEAVADEASAEGTYVLAAAEENKTAIAPPGARFTAFTGELLRIFEHGISGRGPLLDLDSIYQELLAVMREKGHPRPQKRDRNTAGQLAMIRNRAYVPVPAVPADRDAAPAHAGGPSRDGRGSAGQAPPAIVAEWALWGKETRTEGYRLLRCSVGELGRPDFVHVMDRYSPGTLGDRALPQVSVTWLRHPLTGLPTHLCAAIHEAGDDPRPGQTPRRPGDSGRETVRVRLFCVRYDDVASQGFGYRQLYHAFQRTALPVAGGQPIAASPAGHAGSPPSAAESRFAERVAALLLTTRPVCILGADEVPLEVRLQFIDLVMSGLPYGARSQLSAATWVNNTTTGLRFRLFFASAPRDQGRPADDDGGSETPGGPRPDVIVHWGQPETARTSDAEAVTYLGWDGLGRSWAPAALAADTTPVDLADKPAVRAMLARMKLAAAANLTLPETLALLGEELRSETRPGADLSHRIDAVLAKADENPTGDMRDECGLMIARYSLLRDHRALRSPAGVSLYRALIPLAYDVPLSYASYCEIEDSVGGPPHARLRRVMLTLGAADYLSWVLMAAAEPGPDDERWMESLSALGMRPEAPLAMVERHAGGDLRPAHAKIALDRAVQYLRRYAADARAELRNRGYLAQLLEVVFPHEPAQQQERLVDVLQFVFGARPSRGDIAAIVGQPGLEVTRALEAAITQLAPRAPSHASEQAGDIPSRGRERARRPAPPTAEPPPSASTVGQGKVPAPGASLASAVVVKPRPRPPAARQEKRRGRTLTFASAGVAATALAVTLIALYANSAPAPYTTLSVAGGVSPDVMAFSPDGTVLAGGGTSGDTYLWNAETGNRVAELPGPQPEDQVRALAYSPDGKTLAVGYSNGDGTATTCLWNIALRQCTLRFAEAGSLAFSPKGNLLAIGAGSNDNTTYIVATATGRQVTTLLGGAADAFSGNGQLLATGDVAGDVYMWNPSTWKMEAQAILPADASVASIALTPDGQYAGAAFSDGSTFFWPARDSYTNYSAPEGRTWREVDQPPADPDDGAVAAIFSPNGADLLTAESDGAINVRSVPGLHSVSTLSVPAQITAVSLSPEGKTVAAAGEAGSIYLWPAKSSRM